MTEVLQKLLHLRAQFDAMRADILATVSRRVGLILISQISLGRLSAPTLQRFCQPAETGTTLFSDARLWDS
jgi:hypothetical protein